MPMYDLMELAPTPVEEPCQQVGMPSYDHRKARAECDAFIRQLRRQFGDPPEAAWLFVKGCPHEFGTYLEVAVRYETANESAVDYAYRLEAELPDRWDDQARTDLGLNVPAPIGASQPDGWREYDSSVA